MQVQKETTKTTQSMAAVAPQEGMEDVVFLTFPEGLYGFTSSKSFALKPIKNPKYEGFLHLLNLEEPGISFLLFPVNSAGNKLIDKKDLEKLTAQLELDEETCDIFAITSLQNVTAEKVDYTLNLQAPVVVDTERKVAWQHILDGSSYKTNHRVC